jgi:hypothetical protein
MTQISNSGAGAGPRAFGAGYVFGVPVGDLGWFSSLVMGVASGFAAFFATTFCGIVGILIYNSATHGAVDYALSYRAMGLPVGLVVMAVALGYLGTMWVRRMLRKA